MVNLRIKLPDAFLKEEVICDHLVTRKMKEIWAIELDLANELLRVCKKNNIKIFAVGGTLIGTIRHQGFIPWDDDIDFAMPRKEYKKLCEVADQEFHNPYFFQTEYSDKGSLRGHAQLRNTETTGIVKMNYEKGYHFNQGIFIDIFPVDNIPDDEGLFKQQLIDIKKIQNQTHNISKLTSRYCLRYDTNHLKKFWKRIVHYPATILDKLFDIERKSYSKFEAICERYNNQETKKCGLLSFMPEEKRFYWDTNDFADVLYRDFEFLTFPIPSGYDNQLRRSFGNYMQFVKGGSEHSDVFFDTDTPYTFYLNQEFIIDKDQKIMKG